jgi:hypothetical protein
VVQAYVGVVLPPPLSVGVRALTESARFTAMDANTHQVEEYKYIGTAITEVEKHILQIFGGTIVVAVPLLSAVAGLVLGKEGTQVTIVLAYAALVPNILVIPSFYLLLSQRMNLIRLGSYRRVFLEEQNRIEGWETRLEKFRAREGSESNDPIPYTFWAVFLVSAALFFHGISKSSASLCHLSVLGVPIVFIAWCHHKWRGIVRKELPRYLALWRKEIGGESKP